MGKITLTTIPSSVNLLHCYSGDATVYWPISEYFVKLSLLKCLLLSKKKIYMKKLRNIIEILYDIREELRLERFKMVTVQVI